MDQFTVPHDYAHESPTSTQRYPEISEDIFQWKPKLKSKKGKSGPDEVKTDATSEASTADETCDASTIMGSASNGLQSNSSQSTTKRKCKKRHKKTASDPSEQVQSDFNVIFESAGEKPPMKPIEYSPFITLSCPVCSDPECVLNVAATCPILKHNGEYDANCGLCEANCECIKLKTQSLPVSGLVARDENGVAETLLKKNGGPIENSLEWANRTRWVVPYGISWDHQVGEWITARMQDTSKITLDEVRHKRSKSRSGKRKGKHAPAGTPSQIAIINGNAPNEDKGEEPKVILEGHGFKIFAKGPEKVLINFDTKNCKYLGCSCKTDTPVPNCGCEGWMEDGHSDKKCTMKDKSCAIRKRSGRISVKKETPQGFVDVSIGELDKVDKEFKIKGADENVTDSKTFVVQEDKLESKEAFLKKSPEKTREKNAGKQEDKKKKKAREEDGTGIRRLAGLSAKDVRNSSRTEVLEETLQAELGELYRNENKPIEQDLVVCPEKGCPTYPPTEQGAAEVMMAPMEILGPCMCVKRYCYTSA